MSTRALHVQSLWRDFVNGKETIELLVQQFQGKGTLSMLMNADIKY
jgi:hypothetical protein